MRERIVIDRKIGSSSLHHLSAVVLASALCAFCFTSAAYAQDPPVDGDEALPQAKLPAWEERVGHLFSYELRAEAVGASLGQKNYVASGSCLTGTGVVPVSIYGQNGRGRGFGMGAGLGARAGYLYLSDPRPDRSFPLWGLRATGGIDIDLLYVHTPTGIPETNGELCQRVQSRRPYLEEESGSMLLFQVPIQLGAHLGFGSLRDGNTWSGVLVGAAFAPSLLHLEPSVGPRSTELRWAGVEITLDLVTLEATPETKSDRAHLRFAAFISPPTQRDEALVLKLSVGMVWY